MSPSREPQILTLPDVRAGDVIENSAGRPVVKVDGVHVVRMPKPGLPRRTRVLILIEGDEA